MRKVLLLIMAFCVALTAGATEHQMSTSTSDAVAKPDADSLFALGRRLVRTNPDSAIIVLRDAYELSGDDNLLRASICRQMSNAYHFIDSFQMAVEVNLQAIALRQQCPAD